MYIVSAIIWAPDFLHTKRDTNQPVQLDLRKYCLFSGNYGITVNSEFSREFYFRETSHMRSFVKIESSRNGEITLSFTDAGKSCHSGEFLVSQIRLLALFAKIRILAKICGFTV